MSVTIFFDMDGVLADFIGHAFALHGRSIPMKDVRWDFPSQIGFSGADDPSFWDSMGFDFWSTVPKHADGFDLLLRAEAMMGRRNIGILTSPCNTNGCIDGKRKWIAEHLPEYKRRMFTGNEKRLLAGKDKILVDDNDENCEAFIKAGGVAIKVPRPWNKLRGKCVGGHYFDVAGIAGDIWMAAWVCENQ